MNYIYISIIILLAGVWPRGREKAVGICANAIGRRTKKEKRKEKVLEMLEVREVSNSQIREALGVSERTTVRYMNELEREGRVEQVGNTGRSVTYRLKQ